MQHVGGIPGTGRRDHGDGNRFRWMNSPRAPAIGTSRGASATLGDHNSVAVRIMCPPLGGRQLAVSGMTVRTTLPVFCSDSTYVVAATTCSSGYVRSMTAR
jgi:hypothetical protein